MKCPTCGHRHVGLTRLPKDIPLLPCPCCGGKAEFDDYDRTKSEVLVRCVDCDLNTVPCAHEDAAAKWNRRPKGVLGSSSTPTRASVLDGWRSVLLANGFRSGMSAKEFHKANKDGAAASAEFLESNMDAIVEAVCSVVVACDAEVTS